MKVTSINGTFRERPEMKLIGVEIDGCFFVCFYGPQDAMDIGDTTMKVLYNSDGKEVLEVIHHAE